MERRECRVPPPPRGVMVTLRLSPHPTPYTPHPTPYTPHPTPYTPHPTPANMVKVRAAVERIWHIYGTISNKTVNPTGVPYS
jgi:hypothetical protein